MAAAIIRLLNLHASMLHAAALHTKLIRINATQEITVSSLSISMAGNSGDFHPAQSALLPLLQSYSPIHHHLFNDDSIARQLI
jgi:hypothetical protein